MPAAIDKRRKTSRAHGSKVATSKIQSIQAFGKVTKPQLREFGKNNLKRKHLEETVVAEIEHIVERREFKQRKTDVSKNLSDLPKAVQKKVEGTPGDNVARKRKASEELAATPPPEQRLTTAKDVKRKRTAFELNQATVTPTRGARSLLERFALGASSSPIRDSSPTPINYETPPSSPPSTVEFDTQDLPEALQDLINLHSSFLTALSLYYAHNGLSNPADLRNLYPGIERTWKKRRVNVDDIRRILAVGQDEDKAKNSLFLSDYSHNRICVEVSDNALQSPRRVIDEAVLNKAFTENLLEKWTSFKKIPTIGNPSPTAFLSNLPLLPITTSVSLTDLKPLLAKGQQRLSDLKAGALAAQARTCPPQPKPTTSTTSTAAPTIPTKTRATNLLDRLAAKAQQTQQTQSALPAPLTPTQQSRKRALHRLSEIYPVLQSLASSAQKHDNGDTTTATTGDYADGAAARDRQPQQGQQSKRQVSFTMATVVEVLQGSLRNPISREEAVGCVRVMAEVVPEWVGVREWGRCVGVVFRVGNGGNIGGGGESKGVVGKGELEERVRGMLK